MKRVLVIDDEKSIVEMIRQTLNMEGFFAEVAADGEEGLQKYHSGRFDLVITDINLPKCSGNDVAEQIRKTNHIPMIGISGTPWESVGKYFDTVLQKPFSLFALLKEVQKVFSENRIR